MQRDAMKKALEEAISNVLETMFFEPVQIADKNYTLLEWFSQDQLLLGATLNFNGPFSGSLYVLIPANVVSEITANFLGLGEEEINEEQKRDSVKEALNMIGGRMLSLFDSESVFDLSIPELIEENDPAENTLADLKGDVILIETENNHLAAGIFVE